MCACARIRVPPDLRNHNRLIIFLRKRLHECLDAEKYKPLVEASSRNAAQEGIFAVPTFFINVRLDVGAWPIEEFIRIIEEELAK